jgi:hypothetical protein
MWKGKGIKKIKELKVLKTKNKLGRISLSNFKTYTATT